MTKVGRLREPGIMGVTSVSGGVGSGEKLLRLIGKRAKLESPRLAASIGEVDEDTEMEPTPRPSVSYCCSKVSARSGLTLSKDS